MDVGNYNRNVRSFLASAFSQILSAHLSEAGIFRLYKFLSKCEDFPGSTLRSIQAGLQSEGVPLLLASVSTETLRGLTLPILVFDPNSKYYPEPLILMSLQGNTFEVVDRIGNASPWIPRATGNMRAPARFVVCVYDPDLETLIDQTEIETSFGIEVFDDFIDKMVQAEILEYAKHVQWLPSHVADGNGQLVIGSGAEIRSSNSIPILSNEHFWAQCIRRRVCEIEKCSDESLELMQIVRYRVGDFFGPHFDGGAGVARKKTYLIYVNDDFGGGETRFPRISQSVRPVAGRCIAWENVLRDGRVRWQAEHQGMPVTEGQKVAINVWVR